MDKLKAKVKEMDTDTILECVLLIGGQHVPEEARMVRAALIQECAERFGWEHADALMDVIGL